MEIIVEDKKPAIDIKKFSILIGAISVIFIIIMAPFVFFPARPVTETPKTFGYNVSCVVSRDIGTYVNISYINGNRVYLENFTVVVYAPDTYIYKRFFADRKFSSGSKQFDSVYVYMDESGMVVVSDKKPSSVIDLTNGKWTFETRVNNSSITTCNSEISDSRTHVTSDGDSIYSTIYHVANDYDTILSNGLYREHVYITKPIRLIGINAKIDSGSISSGIVVSSNDVIISGFTIYDSGNKGYNDGGIVLIENVNNVSIMRNVIYRCKNGISISNNTRVVITNNTIFGNDENGILINGGWYNTIKYNTLYNNINGIYMSDGDLNVISENIVRDNKEYGIFIKDYRLKSNVCEYNNAINNTISCSDMAVR